MRKLLNKSESTDETPSESSTTASTTTSNSGKSSSHFKSYSSGMQNNNKIRSIDHTTPQSYLCKTDRTHPQFLSYQINSINRSVSDDNFAEIINQTPGITERSGNPGKSKYQQKKPPQKQNSLPHLLLLNTNNSTTHRSKVVAPINSTNRRYSDIKLSPLPPVTPPTTMITLSKTQPQLESFITPPLSHNKEIKSKKGKNLNLIEHSEEISLISEEELNKKDNVSSRSSEDSSPDLLSLSD